MWIISPPRSFTTTNLPVGSTTAWWARSRVCTFTSGPCEPPGMAVLRGRIVPSAAEMSQMSTAPLLYEEPIRRCLSCIKVKRTTPGVPLNKMGSPVRAPAAGSYMKRRISLLFSSKLMNAKVRCCAFSGKGS